MNARLAQTPPSDYRPKGTTDCMAECLDCGIEWGWGAPVAKLEVLIARHNTEHHLSAPEPSLDPTPKGE